jgi:RNA polymerase sigma factor (sigma-70 family)
MLEGQNNTSDIVMWQLFVDGNDSGLEGIYRLYYDSLYDYGFKWLGNQTLVEDAIQELFIKLMRNRQNLREPVSVKTYLFKALRAMLLDKLKSKKALNSYDELGDNHFTLHLSPELVLIDREEEIELKKKLEQAIAQLTPRQREGIFLRYVEGIPYAEISSMMELTPKATYKLMARAIDALRELMSVIIFLRLLCKL